MPRGANSSESGDYAYLPDLILTSDGPQSDHVLCVRGSEIAFVGPRHELASLHPELEIKPLPGKAIIPGFIDAHTHLGQAFGKAVTGGEPAQIWRRIWTPMEGGFDADTVYASAKWMFLEALRGGFTAVTNFAVVSEEKAAAIHQAARDTGIRLVSCAGGAQTVDLLTTPNPKEEGKIIDLALARAEAHLLSCRDEALITPSLCVPAIQAASGALMRALSEFCAQNGALFQIHTNEHHVEVHWSIVRYGMRPLEFFAENGAVGPHTLHHHSTLVTDREIEILRETRSGVSYNPLASAWKGDRVAPALAFAARGVRFGIGTDSTRADALRLLDSAESCQRIAQGMQLADFSCGSAWTWIDAATRGSADVSGLGGVTGELKPGLRADFLILDRNRPETIPSWDFEWELVRLYNRDQIEAVFVDGRQVLADGRPVGWDGDAFVRANTKRALAAVANAPIERKHGTSSAKREPTGEGKE